MIEDQKTEVIESKNLVKEVEKKRKDGCRLVQIDCVKKADGIEVNYTFDNNYLFSNLRVNLSLNKTELPSISGVYWGAFTYENEISDLFGIKVNDMNLDFKGNFYITREKTPFNNISKAE